MTDQSPLMVRVLREMPDQTDPPRRSSKLAWAAIIFVVIISAALWAWQFLE